MSADISFHNVRRVQADYGTHQKGSWLDLAIFDGHSSITITLFFDNDTAAQAIAETIEKIWPR